MDKATGLAMPVTESPPAVQVVTGLDGGAWLCRNTLFVGRARTREATERRVERALAAVARKAVRQ